MLGPNGAGTATVTPASSLRDVLHEAEAAGVADLQLWGHSCTRPGGAAMAAAESDHFVVAPLADDGEASATKWVLRPKPVELANVRGSNLGGFLVTKMISQSPRIKPIWVVTIDDTMGSIVPKKPEFFLREDIVLQKDQVVRIV